MIVSLRLIGSYRKLLPPGTKTSALEVEIPRGTTVAGLAAQYDVPLTEDSVLLLNGHSVSWDTPLNAGDELAAFSAMAGG